MVRLLAVGAACCLATAKAMVIDSWPALVKELGMPEDAPRVVPPEVAQLSNLTELRLEGERIAGVAFEMWQLPELRVLSLRDNLLTRVDPRAGLEAQRLETLDLGGNQIVELDASLFDGGQTFSCLTELHLDANSLTMLPRTLDTLLMFDIEQPICASHSFHDRLAGQESGDDDDDDDDGDDDDGGWFGVSSVSPYYGDGAGAAGGGGAGGSEEARHLNRPKLNLQGNPLSCTCRFLKQAGGWYSLDLTDFIINVENTVCSDTSELAGRSIATVFYISPHSRVQNYSPCQIPRLERRAGADATKVVVRSLVVGQAWNVPDDPFNFDPSVFHSQHWVVLQQGCRPCAARTWFQDGLRLNDTSAVLLPAYQLRYRTGVADTGSFLCCYSTSLDWARDWTISGLKPAQTYFVSMRLAHNRFEGFGDGTEHASFGYFSSELALRTAEARPSGPPRNVSLQRASERSLTIAWLEIEPALRNGVVIGYRVFVEPAGVVHETEGAEVATVGSLAPGTRYSIAVQGRTAVGWGPLSIPVELQTKQPCDVGTQRVDDACEPCEVTYFGQLGSAGATCTPCPKDRPSTAAPGAVGQEACQAPPGDFFNTQRRQVQPCRDTSVECNATGLTERSLHLRPAMWRPTLDSLALLECPVAAFCRGGQSVEAAAYDEFEGDQYCTNGHTGAFCSGCVAPLRMRHNGCSNCTARLEAADMTRFGVWAIVLGLLPILPACWIAYKARKSAEKKGKATPPSARKRLSLKRLQSGLRGVRKQMRTVAARKSAFNSKLRIVVGFAQVLFHFMVIASALHPSASSSTAAANFVINFDPSALLQAVETGCFFRFGFYDTVIVYTLTPIYALLLMLVALAVVRVACPHGVGAGAVTLLKVLLQMLFFVYPGVSSALFRVFVTTDLPLDDKPGTTNVTRVLTSDPVIRFDSDMSAAMRVYAGVMIAVYPIGVLLFFLFATHRVQVARRAQRALQDQPSAHGHTSVLEVEVVPNQGDTAVAKRGCAADRLLAEAAGFLCEAYRPERSWYESFELMRKLALTSGFLLIQQYARADSLVVFMLLVVLFLVAATKLRPYVNPLDEALAEISLAATLFVVAVAQLSSSLETLVVVSAGVAVFVVLLAIFLAVRDWKTMSGGRLRARDSSDAVFLDDAQQPASLSRSSSSDTGTFVPEPAPQHPPTPRRLSLSQV